MHQNLIYFLMLIALIWRNYTLEQEKFMFIRVLTVKGSVTLQHMKLTYAEHMKNRRHVVIH